MLVLCKPINVRTIGYYCYVTGVPLDTIKSIKAIPQLLASYTQTPVLADDVYAVVDVSQPVTTTNKAYIDNEFKDVEIIVGKGEIKAVFTYDTLAGVSAFLKSKSKTFIVSRPVFPSEEQWHNLGLLTGLEVTDNVLDVKSLDRLQKILEVCIGYHNTHKLAIIECDTDRIIELPVKSIHSTSLPNNTTNGLRELERMINFNKGQVRGNVLAKDLSLEELINIFSDFKDSKYSKE